MYVLGPSGLRASFGKRPSLGSVYSWNDIRLRQETWLHIKPFGNPWAATFQAILQVERRPGWKTALSHSQQRIDEYRSPLAAWYLSIITYHRGGSFKRHGAILFHFKLLWKEVLWSHVHSWVSNQPYNVLVCFWIL